MCIHETIQLSQDGENTIYCADCGREFGHIAQDERETFNAYSDKYAVVVLPGGAASEAGLAFREGATLHQTIYPCRKCAWAARCHLDGEECHA